MDHGRVTTFQVAGIALAASFATVSLVATLRHRIGPRSGVGWVALWAAAGAAIAYPQLTVVVAETLGITRGADLVFYCAILGMFVGFFAVYIRLRELDRNITLLVRRQALEHPTPPSENPSADPTGHERQSA
jgi:hypothetical protein